jgi:putative Holliday junction resolvase
MTYLGLDLGSKTIGVAISESGIIAHTLTTLRFREDDYNEALKLIKPLMMNTKQNSDSRFAQAHE